MFRKFAMAIYRGLFWTYDRGTWQYDLMVALILAFIFFSPRAWFHNQPASPTVDPITSEVQPVHPDQDIQSDQDVQLVSSTHAEKVYLLRPSMIDRDSGQSIQQAAERILEEVIGNPVHVIRIETATDVQGHVVSYTAWIEN